MSLIRLTLVSLLILALPAITVAQQTRKIEAKYNRFDDNTVVGFDPTLVKVSDSDAFAVDAWYVCRGKVKDCQPKRVTLGITVFVKGDKYDGSGYLTILADGKRFPLGKLRTSGPKDLRKDARPEGNVTATFLAAFIPYSTFYQIATSKKIEMKLDITEIELNKEQRTAFLKLAFFHLLGDF